MDSRLSGMTVLITGASGGIGHALAQAFFDEGCNLVLHAGRNLDGLVEFANGRGYGDRAACLSADVADVQQVDDMFDRAVAHFGRVDVCIANAGIWPPESLPLHELPTERIRNVLDVNLLGVMWTVRAFMSGLQHVGAREDGRGASVCLVGSTAGRFGEAGHCEYAVSKAAMVGLMRSVKNELPALDPYGRINLVEPGWTVTPMAREALDQPGAIEGVLRTMPIRQLARPEDIARTAVYLAAPGLARHVSGEIITVAGGMEGRMQWEPDDIDARTVRARLDKE